MNFKINRDLLLSNLYDVSKALSNKPQQPISSGIKLEVSKEKIVLTASNAEIAIQTSIDAQNQVEVLEEGVAVLPGKYLLEIVKKTDDRVLTFSSFDGNVVKITTSRSEFTMNSMDADAFPIISFDCTGKDYLTSALTIKDLIRKTVFAAGINDEQIVLTGVNFQIKGNIAEAVATDRYRLAKKFIESNRNLEECNAIFPALRLNDLAKILDDADEIVEVNISQTKAIFKYRNILFRTRLIKGNYPNTSPLIPREFLTQVTFDKALLINTIERVSLFLTQIDDSIIKLSLNSDGEVLIDSINNEIGAASETITPINVTNIVPFQTAFSYIQLLDAIKTFDSSEVVISFTGEIKPFVITGEYDTNCIQLIVPVRI